MRRDNEALYEIDGVQMEDLINKCVSKFYKKLKAMCPEMLPYIDYEDLKGQAYLKVCSAMEGRDRDVPINYFLALVISNGLQDYTSKEVYQRTGRVDTTALTSLSTEDSTDLIDFKVSIPKDLKERHRKILGFLVEGLTIEEMSKELGLSVRTIANNKRELLNKLQESKYGLLKGY